MNDLRQGLTGEDGAALALLQTRDEADLRRWAVQLVAEHADHSDVDAWVGDAAAIVAFVRGAP